MPNYTLLSVLLLCARASSFAPQAHNARVVDTSLGYLNNPSDPTYTNSQKQPVRAATQTRRRRRQRKSSTPGSNKAYTLHSNRVSELTPSSSADDVLIAIKRAQNLHDSEDIRVVGDFLLHEVNDSFAYGYKGSLLARFAVAALRLDEHDIAREAIAMRKQRFSSSMMPFESAAIVRGLLRLHKVDEAFSLLEDELSIEEGNKDRLQHRASALATIASRNFFENEPRVALQACRMLAKLGPFVQRADLTAEDLKMPWYRILAGASQCKAADRHNTYDEVVVDAMHNFPLEPDVKEVFDRLKRQ